MYALCNFASEWSLTLGMSGADNSCSTAFRVPDDNIVQVQCQEDDVMALPFRITSTYKTLTCALSRSTCSLPSVMTPQSRQPSPLVLPITSRPSPQRRRSSPQHPPLRPPPWRFTTAVWTADTRAILRKATGAGRPLNFRRGRTCEPQSSHPPVRSAARAWGEPNADIPSVLRRWYF